MLSLLLLLLPVDADTGVVQLGTPQSSLIQQTAATQPAMRPAARPVPQPTPQPTPQPVVGLRDMVPTDPMAADELFDLQPAAVTAAVVERRLFTYDFGPTGLLGLSDDYESLGTRRLEFTRYADRSIRVVDAFDGVLQEQFATGDIVTTHFRSTRAIRDCVVDAAGQLRSYSGRCVCSGDHGQPALRWTIDFNPQSGELTCAGKSRTLWNALGTSGNLKWKTTTEAVPAGAVPGPVADLDWLTRPLDGREDRIVVGDLHDGLLGRPKTSRLKGQGKIHKPLLMKSKPPTIRTRYTVSMIDLIGKPSNRHAVFSTDGRLQGAYTNGGDQALQYHLVGGE